MKLLEGSPPCSGMVVLSESTGPEIQRSKAGVAGGDGELGCLCGKAGTSHLCDGSANSSDFTLYITAAQVATVMFMTHEYTTWLIVMVY